MIEDKILSYLSDLSNGALNYYQSSTKVMIMQGTIRDYIEQLQQKNKELKNINDKLSSALNSTEQRIDKAIEYIDKNSHKTEWGDLEQDNESIDINDDITDNDFIINLLSILKGEDKE